MGHVLGLRYDRLDKVGHTHDRLAYVHGRGNAHLLHHGVHVLCPASLERTRTETPRTKGREHATARLLRHPASGLRTTRAFVRLQRLTERKCHRALELNDPSRVLLRAPGHEAEGVRAFQGQGQEAQLLPVAQEVL